MAIQVTTVFQKNWDAIHAVDAKGNRRYKNIINIGSSRSGKTHSLIQICYLYALQNPNKKISVFRDTKQVCKMTIYEDMKKIFVDMPGYSKVKINLSDCIFKFPNGSTIHIEGSDDEVKVHGYTCDILWINEGYQVSLETFNQLSMRCSDCVILDMNPRKDHYVDDLARMDNSIVIHSTWRENSFIPYQQMMKIKSYQPIECALVVIREKITANDALTYDMLLNKFGFDENELDDLKLCLRNERERTADKYLFDVYSLGIKGEIAGRIYKFGEIDYYTYMNLNTEVYYGVDFGLVDPFAIVEVKLYDGAVYLHELNYESENELTDKLTIEEQKQINSFDEEGLTCWLFNKLNIKKDKLVVCDSNRPAKIIALRNAGYENAISVGGKDKIIDRITNLKSLNVYYTSTSKNLRYEQENYKFKFDRYGIAMEKPEQGNDHLMDASAYVISKLVGIGALKMA